MSATISSEEIEQQWKDFKEKHKKQYADEKEEEMRKNIFIDTLKMVKEHNEKHAKGEVTYTMGINPFADLTAEERKRNLGCVRPPKSN